MIARLLRAVVFAAALLSASFALAAPSPIAFTGTSGADLFWPTGGPVASGGTSANGVLVGGRYLADPYASSSSGSAASHVTPAVLAQIAAFGIDHLRDQVSPGPWLQAMAAGTSTAALDAQLDGLINSELASGLGVVFSPYASGYTDTDVQTTMLASLTSPAYLRYKAWLVALATRYANLDPAKFAIELTNEPVAPGQGQADWATVIQPDLYAAVRAAAPKLTIILTPANYGDLHLLGGVDYSGNGSAASGMNPSLYDTNTIWSPHLFIPAVYVLQGANYDPRYKYVHGISWPPVASDKAAVIAAMTAAVNADSAQSDKSGVIDSLAKEIGYYYSVPENLAWINGQLDIVTRWCAYWGLPPAAIYVGEYGNLRSNSIFQASDDLSRIRFHRDLHIAIAKHGFRSAFDHIDTYDYGVTAAPGAAIGTYVPGLMTAIGADRLHLVRY